jgi:hypothetical protein
MANLWSRENPLDPGTIPDVIRIMRQEIPDIEYKYHQTYREILIMEVMIAQRVRGGSKATRIAPHRFMVIGQNKNNGHLVTAHFFGTKMAWIHGLEKLTGRSQGLQDDISWASGLQLVLKLGVDHTARYQKPMLLTCRKDFATELCKAFRSSTQTKTLGQKSSGKR